jgi:hypothetical protein
MDVLVPRFNACPIVDEKTSVHLRRWRMQIGFGGEPVD